ncbi:threonine synthase [Limnochorda pilosa]|uniref:Threonine synthase n=1 Tax=Limnochorda pilosa TaxID=1555112 RepID=A0A0K2SGC3_LIMPI|nr:threonine synthase [Limnochorda pilosa]BAS26097.1 threonine synthase [Limnochorda pilosa]
MSAVGLVCSHCGARYPVSAQYVCTQCFGSLEVAYDWDAVRHRLTTEPFPCHVPNLWRYRALLPVGGGPLIDLGTGFTPLLRADRLARELDLEELWIKNDTVNPTYSFKDRVVSVAVTAAQQMEIPVVACASTGNLAGALAAHAARAGLPAYVFVPADLEPEKLLGAAVYGPQVVAVRGSYDQVNRLCVQIADRLGWGFVNINLRPFYSEGSKTLAFETAEQLGWSLPDHVVVPVAGGSLLSKIGKGFRELLDLGLVSGTLPRISAAQAAGCAPVAHAWEEGRDQVQPVRPNTIARSLAIGNPADGALALRTIRESGGAAAAVTDREIVEGIQLLARTEGIFAETAGGVTVAALRRLVERGQVKRGERIVLYITGNGYKTVTALEGTVQQPPVLEPRFAEFERWYGSAPAPIRQAV